MRLRAVVLRVVRAIAISLLTLFLLVSVAIQIQDYSIRRRSERLLADFHSIRLNQTTWPETQALIQRWGELGRAHGPCNAMDCAYDITVVGWPSLLPNADGTAARWLFRLGRFRLLLQLVGMRFSVLELRFLVEDGVVRRTKLSLSAETGGALSVLLLKVMSHASLRGSDDGPDDVGNDEELGVHPGFIVGADGFCTGCENMALAYTPQIAQEELVRLTSFNLSCLTWRPCAHLKDIAPALMREDAKRPRDVHRNSVPCTTAAWALARDASAIWLVNVLATTQILDPNPPYGKAATVVEEDQIKLVKTIKGTPFILPKTILRFRPYAGTEYEARAVPEHLSHGHRYILLPSIAGKDWMKEGVEAWRCGVLEDTPANELSIQQGIAMDDHLRAPELTWAWAW